MGRHGRQSSVTDMLKELEWEPLQDRRRRARLTMLFKMTEGMVRTQNDDRLVPAQRRSRHMNERSFQLPSARTDSRKFSFFPRTIREWNKLPNDIVAADSLEEFKVVLA